MEEIIKKIAFEKYPKDEFWIGDLATGRMYDQNERDRNHFIKGLKYALEHNIK